MLHSTLRVLAVAAALTAPLGARSAQVTSEATRLQTARVEVADGRVTLIGSGAPHRTLRKGEREDSTGRSQLEVPFGSEARISWSGTCSVHVFGPSSIEWDRHGASIGVKFHELAWADFECREGRHELFLPSEWTGTFGRSAFHVRGVAGGPCELRLQAGAPLSLQWEGHNRFTLPPMHLYPGSSVRLDRPRFMNSPVAAAGSSGTWETEVDQFSWPWSTRARPGQPAGNRLAAGEVPESLRLHQQSAHLKEGLHGPGATAWPHPRPSVTEEPITYAQEPVTPHAPTVEFEGFWWSPPGKLPGAEAAPSAVPSPAAGSTQPGVPAVKARPAPEPAHERAAFSPDQWRGFSREDLNHSGAIVAERSNEVEYRVLGQGRCKILVSMTATQPRWCFTPKVDLQMQPGSVAVIESDGTLRMCFGEVAEFQPPPGRPGFDALAD